MSSFNLHGEGRVALITGAATGLGRAIGEVFAEAGYRLALVDIDADAGEATAAALRERTEVQNIDLMTLAGFCRNCLSKWYRAAAEDRGIDMDLERAREIVYGMPYDEWKAKYQTEASADQRAAYEARRKELGL